MESNKLLAITMHSEWCNLVQFVQELIDTHEHRLHAPRGNMSIEDKIIADEVSRKCIQDLSKLVTLAEDIRSPQQPKNTNHIL